MSSIAPLAAPAGSKIEPAKMLQLRQQAEELEGIFLNTLLKEMFASVKSQDGEMGGGGFAEETWRGMQAEQMANSIAEGGGIGLAEALLPDLIAAQEAAQNATPARGAM
jgi:Rod binding domain-containing protein